MHLMNILGKNPSQTSQSQFVGLENYQNGQFRNPDGVQFSPADARVGQMLRDYLRRPATVTPSRPIPSVTTDLRQLPAQAAPTLVWFGHSSYLIKAQGLTVLVDPVFSGAASPVPYSVKAYAGANTYQVADLPPIDVLLITHDHYDHLDYATVRQLRDKVARVVVPLGVGSHFRHWGFEAARITELNWHDTTTLPGGAQLTATPAQHMSGRGVRARRTLWASYVLQLPGHRLFLGGDSGYGPHFQAIGAQYGPFDLAVLENGQYNELWHAVHTLPAETARAAQELGARLLLPVHWAKFTLGYHPWNEPIRLLLPAAASLGVPVTVPRIGEPYTLGEPVKQEAWWDFD
ncbi:MBL fold metallo-hydrolase [Hymenobacter canadensis]|uniref:MBL fold metallo-hydrolase n=1 Tax=Hymenobacter canadensis TaxID=2999067 RepID=A0ABY7LW22_9BACT|nr:MBL fold metallo-hydrolase [Hymenobacter canadensis]WBA43118.1 MBL fold metallo-hydrolase [Hymenobacter canadensis]